MQQARLRTLARAAVTVGVLQLVVGAVTLVWHASLATPVPVYGYWLENSLASPVFVFLATLLLLRRPAHPLSWMFAGVMLAGGTQFAAGSSAHLLAALGTSAAVTTLSVIGSLGQMLFVMLLLALILLFPTGHLPGRGWRVVAWVFAVGAGASLVTILMAEGVLPVGPDVESPFAAGAPRPLALLSTVGAVTGIAGSIASVAVRFRRASGVERQQLRWFLASVVAGLVAIVALPFGALGWAIGPAMVPAGVAIAILRYRLYDLDRIVSRTITYGLVSLVLAGVYIGLVVGIQAVVGPDDASDIVVAGATLASAALFRPVRRRIQRVVDRRFNRSRYDAEVVMARFAERLRDQLGLPAVAADLRGAVASTLHPQQVSLWLPAVGPPGH